MNQQSGILEEFLWSMNAIWGICLGKANAEKRLDTSFHGFINSFFAFVFLLPLLALMSASQWDIAHDSTFREIFASSDIILNSFSLFLWTRLGIAAINFLIFPVVMFYLTTIAGNRDRYMGFIVGWNWTSIPTSVLFLLPFLLFKTTLAAPELVFLLFAFWLASIWMLWRVIRALLAVGWLAAVGVLVVYVALALLLDLLYSMVLAWAF